eukprot:scaffold32748_cov16-Tisochrysis_lutea.AAC.3
MTTRAEISGQLNLSYSAPLQKRDRATCSLFLGNPVFQMLEQCRAGILDSFKWKSGSRGELPFFREDFVSVQESASFCWTVTACAFRNHPISKGCMRVAIKVHPVQPMFAHGYRTFHPRSNASHSVQLLLPAVC